MGASTPATSEAARQAVRLGPMQDEAHRVLGSALLQAKRTDEAEREFREALRLDPQSYSAQNELARLHLARRNIGAAAAGFAGAAALGRTDNTAARNLEVVATRALRYVHLVMWVALIVTTRVHEGEAEVDQLVTALGWVAITAVLATFGVRLQRNSNVRFVMLMRIVARRHRLLGGLAACLAVAYVGFTLAALAPFESMRTVGLLVATSGVVVGAVLTWVRRGSRLQRRTR